MAVHRDAAMRRDRGGTRRRHPVTVQRVRPDIWATVRRLTAGQPGAVIRIVGPRHVEIIWTAGYSR